MRHTAMGDKLRARGQALANFQSADLKSILDALMSKDMTKVAPATIRKMPIER